MNSKYTRNVFTNPVVAFEYDSYYHNEPGKTIDKIEKEIFLSHLNNVQNESLLELGCGTGHWTQFLSEKGFRVTAIDNSEAMLKIARGKKLPNVLFQKADASRLPFPDKSFSAIVSVTMLEFVEDVKKVMDEIDRVIKPGGTLILGCLSALSELGKNKENDRIFKHGRFFTPGEIEHLLSRFGNPTLSTGVYFSPDFELLDETEKQKTVQPAFIAASVQKIDNHGNYS